MILCFSFIHFEIFWTPLDSVMFMYSNVSCPLTIGPCITPICAPPAFSSNPPAIWAAKFCRNTTQVKRHCSWVDCVYSRYTAPWCPPKLSQPVFLLYRIYDLTRALRKQKIWWHIHLAVVRRDYIGDIDCGTVAYQCVVRSSLSILSLLY